MTLDSTKAWKHYMLLCRTLDRNGIVYRKNDKRLCLRCSLNETEGERDFLFSVEPEKMLVCLYSPMPFCVVPDEQDIAFALCLINNELQDGCFCYDCRDKLLYFRMTTSFYESNLCGELFEYMLSHAADMTDKYSKLLKNLSSRVIFGKGGEYDL